MGRSELDPYVENSFGVVLLEYDNKKVGTFTKVSGGAIQIAVIPYTLNLKGRGSQGILMPGASGPEPITLSYGVTDDMAFWKWWSDMSSGYVYRRVHLSLIAFGAADKDGHKKIAEWHLEHAWPQRISGFNFDLDSNSAFIAEVTLAVESITRQEPAEANLQVKDDKIMLITDKKNNTTVDMDKGYDTGY